MSWPSTEPPAPALDKSSLMGLLVELNAAQLRAFAETFAAVARVAADRAKRLDKETRDTNTAAARVASFKKIPVAVAECIAAGETRERAEFEIAERFQVPVHTVQHYCKTFARGRTSEIMTARKLAIVRRALAGARNEEIAIEFDVSTRTIERALAGLNWSRLSTAA